MTPPLLTLEPLTKAAFAPFGTVIETEGAPRLPINQGTTTRFDALAAIDAAHGGGSPIISLFRGTRRPDPIAIRLLERHPLGSQAFYPLVDAAWLVVVAPNSDMDPNMGNDMVTDMVTRMWSLTGEGSQADGVDGLGLMKTRAAQVFLLACSKPRNCWPGLMLRPKAG